MAFLRSVKIKRQGSASKYVAIPYDWGFQAGDWVILSLHDIRTNIVLHATLRVRERKSHSQYITVPADWPVLEGDLVDIKLAYAGIPSKNEEDDE